MFSEIYFVELAGNKTHENELLPNSQEMQRCRESELCVCLVGYLIFVKSHGEISHILQPFLKLELRFMYGSPLRTHTTQSETVFWTHYNDLEQLGIELQSSLGLVYFTQLIFIWNQTINSGCQADHISFGIFYVDGVTELYTGSKLKIGKETQGKVLLVLTEESMLDSANEANIIVKENWFHSNPAIEEVFHLLRPPEEINRHFGLSCGLLVKLRLVRRMITEADIIWKKTTGLTSISYHLVLHMWKERPPDEATSELFYQQFHNKEGVERKGRQAVKVCIFGDKDNLKKGVL